MPAGFEGQVCPHAQKPHTARWCECGAFLRTDYQDTSYYTRILTELRHVPKESMTGAIKELLAESRCTGKVSPGKGTRGGIPA